LHVAISPIRLHSIPYEHLPCRAPYRTTRRGFDSDTYSGRVRRALVGPGPRRKDMAQPGTPPWVPGCWLAAAVYGCSPSSSSSLSSSAFSSYLVITVSPRGSGMMACQNGPPKRNDHVGVRFPELQQPGYLVVVRAGHGVPACSIAADRASGLSSLRSGSRRAHHFTVRLACGTYHTSHPGCFSISWRLRSSISPSQLTARSGRPGWCHYSCGSPVCRLAIRRYKGSFDPRSLKSHALVAGRCVST
jgi:hypothetical protein